MQRRQYLPHPQYNPHYDSRYSPQYHSQYQSQPQYSSSDIPQYSSQNIPDYRPQYSTQYNSQCGPQSSSLYSLQEGFQNALAEYRKNTEYTEEERFHNALSLRLAELEIERLQNEQLENELHQENEENRKQDEEKAELKNERLENEERRKMRSPFQTNHIVIRPVSAVSVQKVVPLEAAPVQKTVEVEIPSPPVQQIVTLKAPTPHQITKMRIVPPPIQKVVPLKCFPIQKIVTATVPSQETPIQSVVTLKTAPIHRIVEMSVPSQNTPIQQVVSLQITPPKKLIESPVSPRTNSVSELSFFWDHEVEIMNENDENVSLLNENENEIDSDSEFKSCTKFISDLSFFWSPEEVNEDVVKCASDIVEFTLLKSNPIVLCRVPTVPIQHVPTVHRPSPICDAFLTILIVFVYIAPPLISKTKYTTSPPRPFPTHKLKVTPQKKPQFSGSCVIKSRQLRRKGKRVRRQFAMEKSSFRSFRSLKDSSRSWKRRKKKRHCISSPKSALSQSLPLKKAVAWKFRKKKPVHSRRPLLKESASWKRRKKKTSLVAGLELSHNGKGPALKRCLAWKRRKKKSRCSKGFFDEFDWDPDAVFQGESRQASSSFQFTSSSLPVFSSSSLSSPRGKECNMWILQEPVVILIVLLFYNVV